MALFKVSVIRSFRTPTVVLEPGMSVQVSQFQPVDPLSLNGGKLVQDAFMRVYGFDLKKAGLLNHGYLRSEKIG